MKTNTEHRDDWNRDIMERGRPQPGEPMRQIDPGTYTVLATSNGTTTTVGMVFAEGEPDKVVIEHWILSEPSVSPTAQRNLVVEPSPEEYASLPAFFRAMRDQSRAWEHVRYIKATCEYSLTIPEL